MTADGISVYISGLKPSEVPWERLVSTYGWASNFPALLERVSCGTADEALSALDTLAGEMEHQDTLWPCTPFALVFLVRALEKALMNPDSRAACRILDILTVIAEGCAWAFSIEHAEPLPRFADMLDERHLPPSAEKSRLWRSSVFPMSCSSVSTIIPMKCSEPPRTYAGSHSAANCSAR